MDYLITVKIRGFITIKISHGDNYGQNQSRDQLASKSVKVNYGQLKQHSYKIQGTHEQRLESSPILEMRSGACGGGRCPDFFFNAPWTTDFK